MTRSARSTPASSDKVFGNAPGDTSGTAHAESSDDFADGSPEDSHPEGGGDGIDASLELRGLTDKLRLDKWLWAARFFKTRSLAADEIDKGRIQVNGQVAKASRELRAGDQVDIRHGPQVRTIVVKAASTVRGGAPMAALMYDETPESLARKTQFSEQRRLGAEPADAIEQGRPTKRDRRQLADWQRWSASADKN